MLSGPILHSVFDPHHRVYFCSTLHACKFQSFSVNFNFEHVGTYADLFLGRALRFLQHSRRCDLEKGSSCSLCILDLSCCHLQCFNCVIYSLVEFANILLQCFDSQVISKDAIIMICNPSGRRGSLTHKVTPFTTSTSQLTSDLRYMLIWNLLSQKGIQMRCSVWTLTSICPLSPTSPSGEARTFQCKGGQLNLYQLQSYPSHFHRPQLHEARYQYPIA
ncbi:hypothetical protein J595_01151 [Acinetobacter sp. 1592897]|nr:hypothetical protein J595_01151 [Acinetobacter sp. 1592897]